MSVICPFGHLGEKVAIPWKCGDLEAYAKPGC